MNANIQQFQLAEAEPLSKPSWRRHVLLASGMAKLVLLLALYGCAASSADSNERELIAVRTAAVERALLAPPVRVSGILAGKQESKLSFKVGGIIERILVREGQRVQAGQLLARLKLAEIEAQVNQAQNAFDKAARDLQRVQHLYDDKVATLEQLQDATTGYEMAKSGLAIAQFNRRFAAIYAPASGTILKRYVEENELVSGGLPVLAMSTAVDCWILKAGLADRDVVRVALGDSAQLSFDAFPGHPILARVTEIAGTAAPLTGTFEVELTVAPQTGLAFLSGLLGKAEIRPSRRAPVWLVPIAALVEADGNRGSVYTVTAAKTAEKAVVTVAFLHGEQMAISAGLEHVTEVVTAGAAYLTPGAPVQIVP